MKPPQALNAERGFSFAYHALDAVTLVVTKGSCMAQSETIMAEVRSWLEKELETIVEPKQDFDSEDYMFRAPGTKPMRTLRISWKVAEQVDIPALLRLLSREQVGEVMRSGRCWKAHLTPTGLKWMCAEPQE
jgi:hypothetical protein